MKARDFRWFNTKYTTRFLYVSMYVSRANDSILLRSICKTDLFPHSFLPSPISLYVSPVASAGLITLFLFDKWNWCCRCSRSCCLTRTGAWTLVPGCGSLAHLSSNRNKYSSKAKILASFSASFRFTFFVAILLMFRMRPMLRKRSRAI